MIERIVVCGPNAGMEELPGTINTPAFHKRGRLERVIPPNTQKYAPRSSAFVSLLFDCWRDTCIVDTIERGKTSDPIKNTADKTEADENQYGMARATAMGSTRTSESIVVKALLCNTERSHDSRDTNKKRLLRKLQLPGKKYAPLFISPALSERACLAEVFFCAASAWVPMPASFPPPLGLSLVLALPRQPPLQTSRQLRRKLFVPAAESSRFARGTAALVLMPSRSRCCDHSTWTNLPRRRWTLAAVGGWQKFQH